MSIDCNNSMSEQEQREQQERMEKCRALVNITGDVVYDYDLVSCAGAAFRLYREPRHSDWAGSKSSHWPRTMPTTKPRSRCWRSSQAR
jgi:hypothetical protein